MIQVPGYSADFTLTDWLILYEFANKLLMLKFFQRNSLQYIYFYSYILVVVVVS